MVSEAHPGDWPKDNRKTSRRGKKVATPEAVAQAVKRIVARGERPTIHRVMYELKGGSMTTISRLLRQINPEITLEHAERILSKRRNFAPGITCVWFPYYRHIVIPFSETPRGLSPAREIWLWREMNPFLDDEEYRVALRVSETLAKVLQGQDPTDVPPLESLETFLPEDLWDLVRRRQRKVTGHSGETLVFFHTQCPKYDFLLLGFVENENELVFMGEDSFKRMNPRLVQNIYRREEMDEILEVVKRIEKKINMPQIKAKRKAVWFDEQVEEQIQKTMRIQEVSGLRVCVAEVMLNGQVATIAITPACSGWRPIDTLLASDEKVQEIFRNLNPGASLGLLDLARQLSCEVAHWGRKIRLVYEWGEVCGIPPDEACRILQGLLLVEDEETQPRYDPKYFWAFFQTEVHGKPCRIPCIWDEETQAVSDLREQITFYGVSPDIVFRIYRRYNPDGNLWDIMDAGSEIILRASGFCVKPANFRFRPSRPKALFNWA